MTNKLYTLEDWRNDRVLKVQIGQYVDYAVIDKLMDGMPPLTHSNGIFQVGEPYDQNIKTGELLYQTFIDDNGYKYVGLCPEGSTTDESKETYGYQNNLNNIQENKKLMKVSEKELYSLVNECIKEYVQENQLNEKVGDKLAYFGKNLKDMYKGFANNSKTYETNMENARLVSNYQKQITNIYTNLNKILPELIQGNLIQEIDKNSLSTCTEMLKKVIGNLKNTANNYQNMANSMFKNLQQPQQQQNQGAQTAPQNQGGTPAANTQQNQGGAPSANTPQNQGESNGSKKYMQQLKNITDPNEIQQMIANIEKNMSKIRSKDKINKAKKQIETLQARLNELTSQPNQPQTTNTDTDEYKRQFGHLDENIEKAIRKTIKKHLNERIKSEKGMTPDQVRQRRLNRYMDDTTDVELQSLQPLEDWDFEKQLRKDMENDPKDTDMYRQEEHNRRNVCDRGIKILNKTMRKRKK